jgi:hypothetical protein
MHLTTLDVDTVLWQRRDTTERHVRAQFLLRRDSGPSRQDRVRRTR